VIAKVQPSKRKSRSSFKRLLNYLTMERDPDTGKTLLRGDVVMSHNLVGTCLKDLTTFVADKIPPAISTVTVAPAPAAAAPAATTHGTAVPAVPSMLPTAMRLNDPIALGGNSMQDLMNAQLQIMQMQLQVLNGSGASIPAVPSAVATAVPARIEPVV